MRNEKIPEHVITEVLPGSISEEFEIEAGDTLLMLNDNIINDVFDYRYLTKTEYVEALIRRKNGEEWLLEIDKDYDEDLGLEFENGLMSEYRSCSNKCIFCFIDQMPPGMRDTLYFKDDDSRLSFLQGNYITLTNMTEKDIERIVKMQMAPVNISVHTMNPELRCKMLNNRFAGEKLKLIDLLYQGHVEMNGQIVLCKGVNDGEELKHSIKALSGYLPFMRSVSVVPAGVTKYREGLYPIELYQKDEACEVIDLIEGQQQSFFEEFGLHFIHASDEWYVLAGRDFPEEDRYDGYIQLENGVGMMRLLIEEFEEALNELRKGAEYEKLKKELKRTLTLATGKLAHPLLSSFADELMREFEGLRLTVLCITNNFFGETITVSGLITGQDLTRQVKEFAEGGGELGDTVLIPSNMLRAGEQVFLDDFTVDDVERQLGVHLTAVESGGGDLLDAILNPDYKMKRDNAGFVYIRGYVSEHE